MDWDALTDDLVVVFCTVPDAPTGEAIADALVGERLVACVNIIPGVRSIYRWKGEVCRDDELLLVMKTRSELAPELAGRVKALHPYETPELICLPMGGGSAPYAEWVRNETRR